MGDDELQFEVWPMETYDEETIARWSYDGWTTVESVEEGGVIAQFANEEDAILFAQAKEAQAKA